MPDFYEDAYRRMRMLTGVVGIAGTLAVLFALGLRPAAGFLLGAVLSFVNFLGLGRMATSMGGSKRPGVLGAVSMALRYVLLGAALYVIVKILGFTPIPVLSGLLAAFGGVILEILYELIFRPANQ